MAEKVYSGGCDCGAVRITAKGDPVFQAVCHCLNCQHSSGAGHNFFVAFPADKVEISGKTSVYNYKADSGNTASSHFCPICGSQLYGLTTGFPGLFVDIADTVKGFAAVVNGEYDHLPESAFYMVGTIEDAVKKAQKMAAEVA